jgi:hypothetical protein
MFYLRTNVSPTLQTNELCYHLLMIIGGLTTMLGTLQGGCYHVFARRSVTYSPC